MGYDKYGINWKVWGNPQPKTDNEPELASSKKTEPVKRNTGIEESKECLPETKTDQIKFVNADKWVEGENGFLFNEKCKVTGTAQFLRFANTTCRKIEADLYVETNDGIVENLNSVVSGNINDNGEFSFEVTLFFGNHYYTLLNNNSDEKCRYFLKNIRHPAGVNTIDSIKLEMPAKPPEFNIEFSL
jgi:hypothetical protein